MIQISEIKKYKNICLKFTSSVDENNPNLKIITVAVVNEDNLQATFNLEEDVSFKLIIKKGIGNYFNNELIDFQSILYENNNVLKGFKPSKTQEKIIVDGLSKDAYEQVITFRRGTSNQNPKILKIISTITKNEDSWNYEQQKENIDNMNYSGQSIYNIEASAPVNCKLMQGDGAYKIENTIKLDMHNELYSFWPTESDKYYDHSQCYSLNGNTFDVSNYVDINLAKYLSQKNIFYNVNTTNSGKMQGKLYIQNLIPQSGYYIKTRDYFILKESNTDPQTIMENEEVTGGVLLTTLFINRDKVQKDLLWSNVEYIKCGVTGNLYTNSNQLVTDTNIINQQFGNVALYLRTVLQNPSSTIPGTGMLKESKIDNRVYFRGEKVPILVKFDRLMDGNIKSGKQCALTVNNIKLKPYIANDNLRPTVRFYSSAFLFLYEVTSDSPTNLTVQTFTDGVVYYGSNLETIDINKNMSCTLVPIRICDAIQNVTASSKHHIPTKKEKVDIIVNLVDSTKYKQYYDNDYDNINNRISKSVYATIINKNTKEIVADNISLIYSNVGSDYSLKGSCNIDLNISNSPKEYIVKLYTRDRYVKAGNRVESDYSVLYNKSAIFSVQPVVYVNENDLSLIIPVNENGWPSGRENVIYNVNKELVEINYTYTGSATFASAEDFSWSVDDNSKAEIIEDKGKYYIQALGPGEIVVKLTALNGDVNESKNITKLSTPIEIIYKDDPMVLIPTSFSHVEIVDGQDATIRYNQNLTEVDKEKDVEFIMDIYDGYYDISNLYSSKIIETLTFTRNTTSLDKNKYNISKDILTLGPSRENTPKYTIVLKSIDPYNPSEELYDIAYITVIAKQIKFKLNCGDKTTYMDSSDDPSKKTIINIDWEIENTDSVNGSDVTFQIDKNGQVLQDSIKHLSDMIKQPDGKYIGSYNLELTNVDENIPKDIYTVSIKGKNALYKEYSYESKIFNVYSASSLKILINNEDKKLYDMNNYNYISHLNLNQLSSEEIEKLRRELNLKAKAAIKSSTFNEYEDLLSWQTSDNEKLTINYFNGVNYQDIEKTIYKYFAPSQQFLLSGLKDGKVIVTATHAQTNREDKVEINISSLKDKFYLFKFYPKVKTTVNYTDSQNNKRTVTSNDEGMLALYEPNTINSDIYVKSVYNDEIYLGTIMKINLLSGEKDVTKNALYPINFFTLRRISVVDIYLKKDEATPYKGRVEVHGGVYKNDGYCQNALINDKTGKQGLVIQADNNGHIRLNMDATQFWSKDLGEEEYVELSSQDRLKFILEIYILDENYYPTIIYLDGNENADDTVRFGNGVINLRKITDNKGQTPFIVNQSILQKDTKKDPTILTDDITKIGPSDKCQQVKLNTDMMMWGMDSETAKEFELRCKDKEKKGQISQSSQIVEYPFAKAPIARNTVDLSKEKIWLAQLEQTKVEFELRDKKEKVLKSEPNKSQIVNMCGVEAVEKSNEVKSQLDKLKNSTSISGISTDIDDKLIKEGIKILSAIGMQGAFFKMAISSTKDPSIYRVFLWAGNSSVGLNIPDSSDIVVLDELENRGLSTVPEIGDLVSMAKGKYLKEKEDTLNNNLNSTKKTSSNTDFSVGLGGYFLAEVDFDYDITKWNFCILSGGFTASASMEYKWTYNSMVGPIPITAYIKFGGGIGANFNVMVRRSQLPSYPWDNNYPYKKANDYLTKINANIYIRAFAGIGFDISVLALRIGIFGQVDVKFETAFLSRIYLSDVSNRELNGQYLQLLGTIGIEFAVTILFIKYEKVLASVSAGKTFKFNKYDQIQDYWNTNSNVFGYDDFSTDNYNEGELELVSSTRTIEDRSYLNKYERYWADSNNISILSTEGLSILQQNAYTNSEPRLSNDGSILIYLSDENSNNISDTKLCYSFKNNQGKFEQGVVIPSSTSNTGVVFNGYGDCNPKIDGNKDFAVATWIRLREDMDISEGSTLSDHDQLYMLNSTEVMLSVWQNNAWNTIRVTEDTTPDLAPVVSTNGDSVLLAWRNVYCNNDENPLDFSIKDNIDFVRINKDNLVINETHNLYNGSLGAIKGLDVAMLKDGNVCVVYVADLSQENIESEYEIFYSIINPNNEIIKTVRLTRDEYLNENPKISTVTLKSGEEKFVIAYHTVKKSEENILSDIRLAFVDKEGTLDVNILEAVSEKVGEENIEISGKYEFVKVDKENNDLVNLALMWTEAYLSIDEAGNKNADKDTLKVVKFVENMDNQISLSSPMNICVMPDRTLVDAFDCSMDNNLKISAVLLGSEYAKIDLEDPSTYKEIMYEDTLVYISTFISNLYTLDSIMRNSISIEDIYVDYNTVKINMNILVLLTLKNDGMDTITNLKIELDTQEYNFDNIALNPNEKIEIPIVYEIGDEINNLPIIITGKTMNNEIITKEGQLYLDYPDVGISKVETISEEDGIRRVRVTLYNSSQCKLGKIGKSVVLGVYEDSECIKPMDHIIFVNNDESAPKQYEIVINNLEDLASIDGGYFTTVFDFNIKEYLGEEVEIPDSGLQINIKAEIKEVINNEEYVLPEIDSNNNISYCTFESLLNKYKEDFTVSLDHEIVNNQSVGDIAIKNNSLKKVNGRLLAKLLDEKEKVIDSRLIDRDDFTSFSSNNLLLNEEEELRRSINFDKVGKSIIVEYNNDEPVEPSIDETSVVVDYDFNEVPRKIKAGFEVFGAGMDNDSPVIGDIRWKPLSYKVVKGENTGVYDCFEYKEEMYFCYQCNNISTNFKEEYSDIIYVNNAGKYTIYITLEKQIFTANGWVSENIKETLKYEFTAE